MITMKINFKLTVPKQGKFEARKVVIKINKVLKHITKKKLFLSLFSVKFRSNSSISPSSNVFLLSSDKFLILAEELLLLVEIGVYPLNLIKKVLTELSKDRKYFPNELFNILPSIISAGAENVRGYVKNTT